MAHDLFNQFGNRQNGALSQLIAQVKQMQQSFHGDPRKEVENLLKNGQMTQEQFNQLAQAANQIAPYLK